MPLQNRVDPFGQLHAVAARGLFTGNRGVLHDPEIRRLLGRRWSTKAWIVCALEWRGCRRDVMGRNGPNGRAGWTELFFLDEVTALAAGHRPCFFCRNGDAKRFAQAFAAGQGRAVMRAPAIDGHLHAERAASSKQVRPAWTAPLRELADGVVVETEGRVFAKRGDSLLPWTFFGYGDPIPFEMVGSGPWRLITPLGTAAALRAGFQPRWHPSAGPPA